MVKIKVSNNINRANYIIATFIGDFLNISDSIYLLIRRWQQIQDATVTIKGLVRVADCGKAVEEEA